MASSAKRRKPRKPEPSLLQRSLAGTGAFVSDNPALVGGSTTFIVALLYVSANALWYQPHAHTGPLFATRSFETFASVQQERERLMAEPQTTFQIERPETPAAPARHALADPVVERVQSVLKDLNFYAGAVDGLTGPATAKAIRSYQEKMGMAPTGKIDDQLLKNLGADDTTGAITPAEPQTAVAAQPAEAPADRTALIREIQQGLIAFGASDIAVDGVAGARTRNAIKEFQALFGLPEDGQPSVAVLDKMRESQFVE